MYMKCQETKLDALHLPSCNGYHYKAFGFGAKCNILKRFIQVLLQLLHRINVAIRSREVIPSFAQDMIVLLVHDRLK